MTNVGLIGRRNKSGEMDFITAIADSQGTNQGYGTKDDTNLKIFTLGDDRRIMLLGTGSADVIIQTADTLRKQQGIRTVQEASEAVLGFTHHHYQRMTNGKPQKLPKDGFATDFILGGPGKNGLEMTTVSTTGFNGDPKTSNYADRNAQLIDVAPGGWNGAFRGSAFRHINHYLDGQTESGRPIFIENIADGLIEMYDLSLRGAKDLGVNDKLHFGVITPERSVRLVHPDAQFRDLEAYVEQLTTLTGLSIGETIGKMQSGVPEEEFAAQDLSTETSRFSAAFYYTLTNELRTSSHLKTIYTGLSEQMHRDDRYAKRFSEMGTLRKESLTRVQNGVDALLSGDAHQMMKYIQTATDRNQKAYTALLKEHGSSE